ncbi:hypothetical protein COY87_03265 [Candidatus Roizmanbacteria bacterium CG_4_10_14_0_8_um_filter_33_9]|uniref:Thioredoxin-like fold domain-containing protein n=1 Tax=Candidatus Roizmanbacteria bacterium CG_4_10_14_0_8_um_filter_33_9 TaxID=1974826 RepID=A0A2M7QI62_9BACT|nr:MAG: hypothetical protein COY87_03265 [Candidatus Roizmanbacteria bacterium CG_4_10_14_0_8_um_filter_33_9]
MRKKIVSHKPTLHTEVKKTDTSELKTFNKTPVLVVLGLVAVFLVIKIVTMQTGISMDSMKSKVLPATITKVIGNPDQKFKINTIKEINGVYEFELELLGATAQKYTSYITKDGKILFTSGIKLDDMNKQNTTQPSPAKKVSCDELPKSEQPKLTAFVVADCPFGLQMQRVVKKVVSEAPDFASDLAIKYIGSVENGKIISMHGDKEAQENLKQICIRDEQTDKYWPYVSCYMQEGKSEECSTTAGINKASLDSCISDPKRGLAFAQKDFDVAKKFNVSGSPTLLLNDKQVVSEFDFGGRNANSLKEIVCCGSNSKSESCGKTLSKTDMATSYSLTEEASTTNSSTAAANCGTN